MTSRGYIKTDEEVIKFAWDRDEIENKGAYINLMTQLNRLAKHTRGGISVTSQRQYYNAMDQFVRYLANEWGVQNLANIAGRHVAAYIDNRQAEGLEASAIDKDLAAIRYFHDQYGVDARHRLPDNRMIQKLYGIHLESRSYGKVNRRWTDSEVEKMIDLALQRGRPDISKIIRLGAGMGLRIHEITRLSCGDAMAAIRSNLLHIKGKNGLERDVPMRDGMAELLRAATSGLERDEKIFVRNGRKTHQVIQSVQDFIRTHRDKVSEPGARTVGVQMTFHGLRHKYAYERYQEFRAAGFNPEAARMKVSLLIGHSRDEITRIYLGESGEETV